MEGWAQIPCQPSNFVSILHLRDRFLKENERNQKEKEDLKQLDRQELHQKVPRTEAEEKDDPQPVVQKPRGNASSWTRNGSAKFQKYYRAVPVSSPRNVNETCKKTQDEVEPPLAVPQIDRDEKEEKKSQPSNFVSILHLRDRWLKENERNQREKEDLKQLDRQELQHKVPRTKPEEKDDQKPVVQKPRSNASWTRNGSRKFRRYCRAVPVSNPRNVNETCKKTQDEGDEGEPQLAVPLIERDEKKKKKSKRRGRKKNPSAQKEEMDKASPTPEEQLKEEMKEMKCEVVVQNGKKNVRARKIDEKKGTGNQCGPKKTGYKHEVKEMENKLSLISVSFEIKRGRNNGVYRGNSEGNRKCRDHRNLDRWGPRKQRDVGMIWVRKDELSKGA